MFEPVNKAHAIVEMVAFFEFNDLPRDVVENMIEVKSSLEDVFPKCISIEGHSLTFQNNNDPIIKPLPGVELKRFRPDGELEWLLRIVSNSFSVHCLDYTRWDEVWDKVYDYTCATFKKIESADIQVKTVGLKYLDRFTHTGDTENYDLETLFKTDSPILYKKAFSTGPRWHSHVGWFDVNDFETYDVLNQINIDAGVIRKGNQNNASITIDHTISLKSVQIDDLACFMQTDKQKDSDLEKLMLHFHKKNKEVMDDLLEDEVAKRIQLNVGT